MAEIKHGKVTLTFADELTPPPEAGTLSPEQARRVPKPPRGVGLVASLTAAAIESTGGQLMLPADVTPASLREVGSKADAIDELLLDLEVVTHKLRQANLLFDAEAWEQVRKLNDQVKVQGKHKPELLVMFKPLLEFFARGPQKPDAPLN